MVSETVLHRLFEQLPLTAFQPKDSSLLKKRLRVCAGILICAALVLEFGRFIQIKVVDILTFLDRLHSLVLLSALVVYLFKLKATRPEINLDKLTSTVSEIEGAKEFNYKLFLLTVFCLALDLPHILKYTQTTWWEIASNLSDGFVIFHCAFIKIVTLKRIEKLARKTTEGSELEKAVFEVRSWVEFMFEINKVHSLQFTVWFVRHMILFTWSMAAFWVVYGLHSHYNCFESTSPFAATAIQCQAVSLGMVMALSCANLQNGVSTSKLFL